MFYGWFDDNPKLTTVLKIADAVAAYARRFGVQPDLVLVNPEEVCAVDGLVVRPESFIRRNNYWVGMQRRDESELGSALAPPKQEARDANE